VGAKFLLTFY